jgi:hypothetical protein
VRGMPEGYDYSLSFFNRFYRPENVVLVIAGDFDFAAAEEPDPGALRGVGAGIRASGVGNGAGADGAP